MPEEIPLKGKRDKLIEWFLTQARSRDEIDLKLPPMSDADLQEYIANDPWLQEQIFRRYQEKQREAEEFEALWEEEQARAQQEAAEERPVIEPEDYSY
ncbi:MAG: hypothetical protein IT210_25425 [Armatimonadetes bacterium]|nr:hypothetical protein [Armatimonadota bacterium]